MKHIVTITLSFCMVLRTINCEKLNGVTVTNCYLEEMKLHDPTSYAFVRVNGTYTEKHVLDEDTVYCEILGEDKPRTHIVALEKVFFGDAPQLLSFQVADVFASELEGNVISCDFRKIAFHIEENAAASRSKFICEDLRSLGVIFIGLGSKPFTASGSGNRDRRRIKREINYSNIECSKGDAGKHKNRQIVGQPCNITDDEYQYKIGRVWQVNSDDALVCLPCCVNHHWDNITKQCMPCKPGTVQPLPNFWSTCEPQSSTEIPEITPESVTAFPLFTTTPIVKPEDSKEPNQGTATKSNDSKQPFTEKVSQDPNFRPPIVAPTGLKVIEIGPEYAKISWNNVSHTETAPVAKYKSKVESKALSEPSFSETDSSNCEATISDLQPDTEYHVTVAAGNEMGYGPFSVKLPVTTIPALKAPKDLIHSLSEEVVTVEWQPRAWESQLGVVIEYWGEGKEYFDEYSQIGSVGKIRIHLSEHGEYNFQMYFTSGETRGPIKEFKILYTKNNLPWPLIILIAGIAIVVLAVALLWCLVSNDSG